MDAAFGFGIIFICTSLGMLLGAWMASRGFEKALKKMFIEMNIEDQDQENNDE